MPASRVVVAIRCDRLQAGIHSEINDVSKKLNELRQRYNEAVKLMRGINDAAEKEDRGLSADEQTKYQNARVGLDEMRTRIEREEQLAAEELRSATPIAPAYEGTTDDPIARAALGGDVKRDDDPRAVAFRSFLLGGHAALNTEQRNLLAERRDMSLTAGVGGVTVPQGFYDQLVVAQRLWGGLIDPSVVTLWETDTGNPTPVPLDDDTANAAAIVSEAGAQTASTDPVTNSITLGAFMYRTTVKISRELLQDSALNLEQYLSERFAIRLYRGFNGHASTGNNSGQPQGIFNATVGANIGHTAATGNTTAFPYISLVALEHSVDPLYRLSRKARWMFSDGVLQGIKSQLDTTGRPIWMPNYASPNEATSGYSAFGATILGYPYVVNPDAPAMAASARSVAFGDFAFYMTRRVRAMVVQRLDELYADNGQIGFKLFARMDGKFANPTATSARSPIRLGQNSAT